MNIERSQSCIKIGRPPINPPRDRNLPERRDTEDLKVIMQRVEPAHLSSAACDWSADGQPDIKNVQPLEFAPGTQEYYDIGNMIGQAFAIGAPPSLKSAASGATAD